MTENGKNFSRSSRGEATALDRKLLAYALAGGAALVGPAHADIISYSGPTLSTIDGPISLDLNNDLTIDFTFTATDAVGSTDVAVNNVEQHGVNNGATWDPVAADASVASASKAFNSLTVLNSAKPGVPTLDPLNTSFPYGSDSYIGLVFEISGLQHYGWALVNPNISRISSTSAEAETQIKAFAYQTIAGVDNLAGETGPDPSPIPEPSTMALLALGSAGLAVARRRSRQS
jgi:hypothetical protein